jgi:antitoxin VapB
MLSIGYASSSDRTMKRSKPSNRRKKKRTTVAPKSMSTSASTRASIFRNGRNQAVRLPQELRFSDHVKEVRIRKLGDGLLLSPVKPEWGSFFALNVDVPEHFLEDRQDLPPQSRDPL